MKYGSSVNIHDPEEGIDLCKSSHHDSVQGKTGETPLDGPTQAVARGVNENLGHYGTRKNRSNTWVARSLSCISSSENASGHGSKDDIDIGRGGMTRKIASDFMHNLEDDARKLLIFDKAHLQGNEDESTPLVPGGKLKQEMAQRSTVPLTRVLITFLKSMVGSYILYTPKMFHNGGLFASVITLLVAAFVACDNMIVLIRCAEFTGKHSFGQIGQEALGYAGLLMVDVSLVLSQVSFCCTYFIFIFENIPSVLPTPAPGTLSELLLAPNVLILLQLLVYIPMAMIRRLKVMALAMLVANTCVWLGLIIITFIDARTLWEHGPEPVLLYNPDKFVLFLGAIIVCFEGIGLVLPVRASLEPHLQSKFPAMVQGVMLFIAVVFAAFGALGYLVYGDHIQTFVTMNIPKGDPAGTVSIALYSVAILFTYPLQLFPAVKCLEGYLSVIMGPENWLRKSLENSLRAAVVLLTAIIARYAGRSFDNFAGLIGGVCAVPLALIYPSVFQLILLGDELSMVRRCWTWLVLSVGIFSALFCSWQSIVTWK